MISKIIKKWILFTSVNHINILRTIFVNFYFLPFSQAKKIPIYIYGKAKFIDVKGRICIDSVNVYRGMIKINKIGTSSCNSGNDTEFVLKSNGRIIFGGKAFIGHGCKIIANMGSVYIGDNFIMNNCNNIASFNKIVIGNDVIIAHQTQVFDSNFHHIIDTTTNSVKRSSTPIIIGDNCWIANRVSIMPGVILPPNTIVASNSLINKNCTEMSCCIWAGMPAKIIAENKKMIRDKRLESNIHIIFHDDFSLENYIFTK